MASLHPILAVIMGAGQDPTFKIEVFKNLSKGMIDLSTPTRMRYMANVEKRPSKGPAVINPLASDTHVENLFV